MSTTTQTCTLVTYEPPYLIAQTYNSFRVLPTRAFLSYPSLMATMASASTSVLKTPTRSTRVMDPPSNTPYNRGAASDLAAGIETTRKHMYPFLVEDLKNEQIITLDKFLTNILRLTPPSDEDQRTISELTKDQEYLKLAGEYTEVAPTTGSKNEHGLYTPFFDLINYVHGLIDKTFCKNETDKPSRVCYHRNETKPVGGSPATRKPDLVMTDERCLKERPSDDKGNKELLWADLFGCIEFKVDRKKKEEPKDASSEHINAKASRRPGSISQRRRHATSTTQPRTPTTTTPAPPHHTISRPSTSSVSQKRTLDNAGLLNGTDSRASKKPRTSDDQDVFDEKDPGPQYASYALELLSVGGWRSHVIGALITDQSMELLFLDRSAIVKSHPFDFIAQPELFFRIVRGLAKLASWEWGLHMLFPCQLGDAKTGSCMVTTTGRTIDAAMYDGLEVKLDGDTVIELGETLALSHGLIGRGTCVVKVKKVTWPGKAEPKEPCVAKFSWPGKKRLNENDFVKTAWEMVWSDNKWEEMAHHLPEILFCVDYKGNEEIQIALEKLSVSEKWNVKYEQRVLRVLISTQLMPLTQLSKANDVYTVFYDILRCYRWLYQVCKIMHRDISHTNVMFRRVGNCVKGVLNDFDLASKVDGLPAEPSSHFRTGTQPFMALDLLRPDPPLHMSRHDLESIFYVMVWQCCRFDNGSVIDKAPYDDWTVRSFTTCRRAKSEFVSDERAIEVTPQHQPLQPLLDNLRLTFSDGLHALARHQTRQRSGSAVASFDRSTLGGLVTFDTIEKVFVDYPPLHV